MHTRRTLVLNHVWLEKQVKWGKLRPEVTTLNRNQRKVRLEEGSYQTYSRTNRSE